MDYIQDYMCRTVPDIAQEIPGALKPTAPEPLLPYPDTATGWNYGMDLCVCVLSSSLLRDIALMYLLDDGIR